MPWIDTERCNSCGICIKKCPAKAISMENRKAGINMDECIHCGTCHSICPEQAVRHDSEKTPYDVKKNVEMTKKFMDTCAKSLGDEKEKWKCLERMKKYFNREKVIAEKTLEEIGKLK
ncbi:MAG: 4Fe-4S binding protein [Endomicrobiales bacterium]|nr:4Fe-4S binding protein [Endomicrobiales bacterium]